MSMPSTLVLPTDTRWSPTWILPLLAAAPPCNIPAAACHAASWLPTACFVLCLLADLEERLDVHAPGLGVVLLQHDALHTHRQPATQHNSAQSPPMEDPRVRRHGASTGDIMDQRAATHHGLAQADIDVLHRQRTRAVRGMAAAATTSESLTKSNLRPAAETVVGAELSPPNALATLDRVLESSVSRGPGRPLVGNSLAGPGILGQDLAILLDSTAIMNVMSPCSLTSRAGWPGVARPTEGRRPERPRRAPGPSR